MVALAVAFDSGWLFDGRRPEWNNFEAKSAGKPGTLLPPSSFISSTDVDRSSLGSTIVAMMQTTKPWHRCHLVTEPLPPKRSWVA
jgi:hypothetical protein